jgi:hypothetical protein
MIDKFFDFYHNHENGAKKFFEDAYSRYDDYDTNYSLQNDMLNHAGKMIGKFVAQNPQLSHDDLKRDLKQKKLDMEREAFNDPSSHLNGAPSFSSMFQKDNTLHTGEIDMSGSSSRLKQKQEKNLQNREVMHQFGIAPKTKAEGNNVVNAVDRFRMKKSQAIAACEMYKSVSDTFYKNDDGMSSVIELLKKSDFSVQDFKDVIEKIRDISVILKTAQKIKDDTIIKSVGRSGDIEEQLFAIKLDILNTVLELGLKTS